MLLKLFSFSGRIRRLQYGISFVISAILFSIINLLTEVAIKIQSIGGDTPNPIYFSLTGIPVLWFYFAQGCKREHDLGYNGWWQLIPFRPLWLIFLKGEEGENKYGNNPKDKKKSLRSENISPKNEFSAKVKLEPLKEIENKELLLFNSMKNNLISDVEYSEKSKKLREEKAILITNSKSVEIENTAKSLISEKAKQLTDLVAAGLLTKEEYTQKYNSLLSTEIEKLAGQEKIAISTTSTETKAVQNKNNKIYPPTKSMVEADENIKKMEDVINRLKGGSSGH